jgi:hypothetical protein
VGGGDGRGWASVESRRRARGREPSKSGLRALRDVSSSRASEATSSAGGGDGVISGIGVSRIFVACIIYTRPYVIYTVGRTVIASG